MSKKGNHLIDMQVDAIPCITTDDHSTHNGHYQNAITDEDEGNALLSDSDYDDMDKRGQLWMCCNQTMDTSMQLLCCPFHSLYYAVFWLCTSAILLMQRIMYCGSASDVEDVRWECHGNEDGYPHAESSKHATQYKRTQSLNTR